mgnify:CR=1 FL=1
MFLKRLIRTTLAGLATLTLTVHAAQQPNILVIWGDDVGQSNISAYTMGVMGYRTPHIDRIAREGIIFTDYYGEQSCTAGRSSFIMGQSVFRTGLSKVGLPGAEEGMQVQDPTIAVVLKDQGYATGQFGKNHLGDRMSTCPPTTVSTSSSATSTTSMPRRNPRTRTTRRTRVPQKIRSARCHPQYGRRQDRGYRSADKETHGNRGR